MSEASRLRIRAQASPGDPDLMGFVLDAPVQQGSGGARLDPGSDAPLARALFALDGVARAEVSAATLWVQKRGPADWGTLKPAIAAAIRSVLAQTDTPLGAAGQGAPDDPDSALLAQVEALLEGQVNPAVAAHGGRITVERVEGGNVFLRMSGGCQGCAASSATLRQGVERTLRAALPQIDRIVDLTDHAAGRTPFYKGGDRPTPLLHRPVPAGVIGWKDGKLEIDAEYLGPRLGLNADALREGLRTGDVVGVTETGEGADAGKTRVVLRSATRAWAAEIDATGAAREIPPPRQAGAAADGERQLAARIRAHLAALPAEAPTVTYGALARAMGLWMPGAVARVTRALEITMREDAAAGRPFIAAQAVSRSGEGLPGRGFFDMARALSQGPRAGESDAAFHARELDRLIRRAA